MITLRDRAIVWFINNPDETLTRADVVSRWGVNPQTAWDCLTNMVADGLLVAQDAKGNPVKPGREIHYAATPALIDLGAAA